MPTLNTLTNKIRRDLRDTGQSDGVDRTWSTQELTELIELGIAEVSRSYPREMVSTVAVPEMLNSFHASSISLPAGMDSVFRIDGLKYRIDTTVSPIKEWYEVTDVLEQENGWGPYSGWELHAGTVYIQPGRINGATSHLRLVGYGDWTVETLDINAEQAVRYYVTAEATFRLMNDRTMFQQWQVNSGATDVSVPMINQNYVAARARYDRLINRMRKLRRVG